MSEVAWLEPYDVESALENWAAWYGTPLDVNDPDNAINVTWAAAVEQIVLDGALSEREVVAVKHKYLGTKLNPYDVAWQSVNIYTALPVVEKELKRRKLLTSSK